MEQIEKQPTVEPRPESAAIRRLKSQFKDLVDRVNSWEETVKRLGTNSQRFKAGTDDVEKIREGIRNMGRTINELETFSKQHHQRLKRLEAQVFGKGVKHDKSKSKKKPKSTVEGDLEKKRKEFLKRNSEARRQRYEDAERD